MMRVGWGGVRNKPAAVSEIAVIKHHPQSSDQRPVINYINISLDLHCFEIRISLKFTLHGFVRAVVLCLIYFHELSYNHYHSKT